MDPLTKARKKSAFVWFPCYIQRRRSRRRQQGVLRGCGGFGPQCVVLFATWLDMSGQDPRARHHGCDSGWEIDSQATVDPVGEHSTRNVNGRWPKPTSPEVRLPLGRTIRPISAEWSLRAYCPSTQLVVGQRMARSASDVARPNSDGAVMRLIAACPTRSGKFRSLRRFCSSSGATRDATNTVPA